MIDIEVISIESADERRENIKKQMEKLDLKFNFFNAVDGRKESHELFKKYNNKKRLTLKGYPLEKGELGCFASHYLLWKKSVDENKTIIIIEDDAEIKSNFSGFYKIAEEVSSKYEYVRLFVNGRKKPFKIIEKGEQWDFVRYLKGPSAARAYMVSPIAAEKFISSADEWILPVDDYMDQFWLNKVSCIGIMPGIVENDTHYETMIGRNKEKRKKTARSIIIRELYHVKNEFYRFIYNQVHK